MRRWSNVLVRISKISNYVVCSRGLESCEGVVIQGVVR